MSENEKKLEVAVFRFGIISEFVTGVRLERGEKERLINEKVARQYVIPQSKQTRIAKSSIKKWISDYKKAGLRVEGLLPRTRKDRGIFKSLDDNLQLEIRNVMRDRPNLTGIALVTELKHRKILNATDEINLSVLYRFLKKEKLNRPSKAIDRRSFEATSPNDLWQSDIMHGPLVLVDGKLKKSYLIGILDDHSRMIIHGEFYLSETLATFKSCLKTAISKRGLPQKLYIDNGSCYRALNLEQITALLGIGIAHTPPYTPQGRGKIEKWFRYVRESFLVTARDINSLEKLNEAFNDWLEGYHNKINQGTGETPLKRYLTLKCHRPAPKDLIDYFRLIEFRTVKQDRTFRLNGVVFEAPVSLIGLRIELRFHEESPEKAEIFHEGRSLGEATLLDRNVNYKIGRNYKTTSEANEEKVTGGKLFNKEDE